MSHIETKLGSDSAAPNAVVELVEQLPSDTVNVPRQLNPSLVSRLNEVASMNGGKVPLHGRLFAQWMHHAYPRECPYPHESGSTSPQTPDEWMRENGQLASASKEEMEKQVESDVCLVTLDGKPGPGCNEAQDLPWSGAEELLGTDHEDWFATPRSVAKEVASDMTTESQRRWDVIFAGVMAVLVAVVLTLDYCIAAGRNHRSKGDVFYINQLSSKDLGNRLASLKASLAIWGLASLAWILDLLDTAIFCCALIGSLLLFVIRRFGSHFLPKSNSKKCDV